VTDIQEELRDRVFDIIYGCEPPKDVVLTDKMIVELDGAIQLYFIRLGMDLETVLNELVVHGTDNVRQTHNVVSLDDHRSHD
jgi:hypothetical protein